LLEGRATACTKRWSARPFSFHGSRLGSRLMAELAKEVIRVNIEDEMRQS
jgi:hypothetical protein